MQRAEVEADQMPGQDSFLDVITNIVGVLILLVLVVGLRSSRAVANSGQLQARQAAEASQEQQVQEAVRAVATAEGEVRDLVRRTADHRGEVMLREQERQWLAETVAELQHTVSDRRAKLSSNDQRDFDLRRQLNEAQLQLDAITREQVALVGAQSDVETIQCEPTPIAKVVKGNEIHLQLMNDYLAYVPVEELTKQMFDDFDQNSWRLKQEDEMIRTLGPVGNFRLQYCFIKREINRSAPNGVVITGQIAQFKGFFLLPERARLGDPAGEALAAGSELRGRLAQVDPTRTTVTIWAYPGNYERLRELKRGIRELGFEVAIRALPKDSPIGFSPEGTRSVVE